MTVNLYRHFDKSGALLYVGISLHAVYRLSQHRASPWFQEISRVDIEVFPTRLDAAKAERLAIETEGPRHNVVGRATEYPSCDSPLQPDRPRRHIDRNCPECNAYRARKTEAQAKWRKKRAG